MDKQEAFESLETIRTILERSTIFAHIAPVSLFLGGGVALAASVLGWLLELAPETHSVSFFLLWTFAFLVALVAGLGTSAQRAQRLGEVFWSRKLQFVLSGFLPAIVAAAILTPLMVHVGQANLCPGIWMILYGLGILSVGVVLDWEFRAAAWMFLLAGAATLYFLGDRPYIALGSSFGGLHLALGIFRLYRESWNAYRDRRQSSLRGFRV